MKDSFLLLFFICVSSTSVSGQEKMTNIKPISGFDTFFLNDSIEKFDGLLNCAEKGKDEIINIKEQLSCFALSYLPVQKNPVVVGTVKFNYLILFADSVKLINSIYYSNSYIRNNINTSSRHLSRDFRTLKKFLTHFLKISGQKDNTYKGISGFKQALAWEKGNIRYVLELYDYNDRKKNVVGSLNLTMYMPDNQFCPK